MIRSKTWPEIGSIPVVGIAVSKLRAPTLHQADRGDDDDAGREHEQAAPFARSRKAAGKACEREPEMRCCLPEAMDESRDREQAESERKNIQHRNPRLHEQHLVEEGEQRRSDRRSLGREQGKPDQVNRDQRERAEQHGGIAPSQWTVAEHMDRQRDELFRQRRMHRIEHRLRHHGFEHLPRRRHVMHFVEIEFFRRGHADQQHEMRNDENDSRNDSCVCSRRTENRRWFGHDVHGSMELRRNPV